MQPPEIPLPCDLPSWRRVQELLLRLQKASLTSEETCEVMREVHALCRISISVREEEVAQDQALEERKQAEFETCLGYFKDIIDRQFSSLERERFLTRTLPCLSRFAVSLLQLRPRRRPFRYMLSGFSGRAASLDRRFVASLLANVFFSTFPIRSPSLPPHTKDLSFATLFPSPHILKNLLNYFDILDLEEPCGHVAFRRCLNKGQRRYQKSRNGEVLSEAEGKPLTPIFVLQEQRRVDLSSALSSVILRDLPSLPSASLRAEEAPISFMLHPEVLVCLLFSEPLAQNECLKISGLLVKSPSKGESGATGPERGIHETMEAMCLLDRMEDKETFLEYGEVENYVQCLKEEKEPILVSHASVAKSSSVSSKSSMLNKLADDLSMLGGSSCGKRDSRQERMLQAEEDNNSCSRPQKKRRKKETFAERLKAALERGNTPDSSTRNRSVGSAKQQQMRQQSLGFQLEPPPDSSDDDDDSSTSLSSYSFECLQGLPGDIEAEYEDLLMTLTASEEPEDDLASEEEEFMMKGVERMMALETLSESLRRRTLSGSFSEAVMQIERVAVGEEVEYNGEMATERMVTYGALVRKSHAGLRRSTSFNLRDQMLTKSRPDMTFEDSVKPEITAPPLQDEDELMPPPYVWVLNPPGRLHPARFLLQWLAVSLSEAPLLVYQSQHEEEEEILLETVFGICSEVERRGWSTKEVSKTLEQFFLQKREEDIVTFFAQELGRE